MNCHLVSMLVVFIAALASTHVAAESKIVSIVQADPTHQILLVRVTNAAAELPAGYTAVQHLEFSAVDSTSGTKELLYRSPGWLLRDMNEQSNSGPLYIPKSALISSNRIEILAEGMLESLSLLRFSRQGKSWSLAGEAWIAEAMRSNSGAINATLVDFGKIRVTDEQTHVHKNYEVDQEGVVRLDGEFYIPKRTQLGGTDGPEVAYRRNYKSHVKEYYLPRDANGITIREDPSFSRPPTKVDSATNKPLKPTSGGIPISAAVPPSQSSAKDESSSFTLMIIGGVIVLGLAGLVYRLKQSKRSRN